MSDNGDTIDHVLVSRLKRVYWPEWCDDVARDRRMPRMRPQTEHVSFPRSRWYDIKRVRHFIDCINSGRGLDPISIDTYVHQYRVGSPIIWGLPIVEDGHHRFIAAVVAGKRRIAASVSGLVRHRDWLIGTLPLRTNLEVQ